MRTKNLALLLAVSLLSLSAAAAPPQAVAGDVVEVRAAPTRSVYLDPVMRQRMQGAYHLDDGRTLKVGSKGRRLTMEIGDSRSDIVHVGGERFEAVGKDVSLQFDDGQYPDVVVFTDRGSRQVASAQR